MSALLDFILFVLTLARIRLYNAPRVTVVPEKPWSEPPRRELNMRAATTLQQLPIEILTMIMEELDCKEVIGLRQCARALSGASRARSVWLSILERSTGEQIPYPLYIPKPLALLGARELEGIITGFWRDSKSLSDASNVVARTAVHRISNPKNSHLALKGYIPGSRFLLYTSDTDGSISYQDTQRPTTAPQLLIPSPVSDSEPVHHLRMTLAFDSLSLGESQAFGRPLYLERINVAVVWKFFGPPLADEDLALIQVWELTAQTVEGEIVGFTGRMLKEIDEQPHLNPVNCSLYGDYLAYDSDTTRVIVVEWPQIPPDTTNFPRHQLSYRTSTHLILLPKRRLAVVHSHGVDVWAWNEWPVLSSSAVQLRADPDPLWTHEQPRHSYAPFCLPSIVPSPFIVRNSIRIPISAFSRLHGLMIPLHGSPKDIQLVPLIDAPIRPIDGTMWQSFGYRKGVALEIQKGTQSLLLQYRWPDDPDTVGGAAFHPLGGNAQRNFRTVHFDECQNKLALHHETSRYTTVTL